MIFNYKNKEYKLYGKKINGFYYGTDANGKGNYKFPADVVEGEEKENKKEKPAVDPVIEQMKKDLEEMENRNKMNKVIGQMKSKNQVQNAINNSKNKKFVNFVSNIQSKKMFDAILNNRYYTQKYPITESTIQYLSGEILKVINMEIFKAREAKNYRGGFTIRVILRCTDNEEEKWFSSSIKPIDNINFTKNEIQADLARIAMKNYDTTGYILFLHSVDVLISKLPDAGGCCERHDSKTEKMDKNTTIKIKSYQSKNDNCLIQCFNQFYNEERKKKKLKSITIKAVTVRKDLKIPSGKIDYSFVPALSDYFNKVFDKKYGYKVVNQNFEFLNFKKYDKEDYIKLLLRDDHYFVFEFINYKQCKECGRKLLDSNTDHKCSFQNRNYRRMLAKDKTFVRYMNIAEDTKVDYNNIVHWDLETFMSNDVNGKHIPYASAYNNGENIVLYYGQDVMKKTLDDFMKMENKIISAYNGSSFDFYYLVEELSNRGVQIKDMIKANGKLMSFTFGNNNKVFDLCLYLTCSLDKACKDYKIKNAKSSFNHNKMKSWADVEKYRNEVEPYLRLDILALKEVFETFNNMMFKKFKINITTCMSAGQLGYNIFLSTVTDDIEIPDTQKYDFIKLGTYGARCYPQQKLYQSREYKNLKPIYDKLYKLQVEQHKQTLATEEYKNKLERVLRLKVNQQLFNNKNAINHDIMTKYSIKPDVYTKLYNKLKETKDFIFNADATSLYPASMAGFDLVKVQYPLGKSRWSDKPEEEYNNNKMGIYEIEFVAPKKLRVPILPTRRTMGNRCVGINWSLHDGKGVYSSVDIQNAISCGYQVKFINKCLVWDRTGDVFSKYINMFYQMKEEAERNQNDVARSVAKLFLNSLYGKTLQKANITTNTLINDAKEYNQFIRDYDLIDFHLYNNKMLVTGEAKDKQSKITKPSQLGCFVTAYSRKIMLTYMKEIDPTLSTCVFTYSDTDSLHMSGEAYEKLKEKGLIKDKKNSKLGYLCSDIDNEGIIFNEINLAPKCYLYEYIDNKGKIKEDRLATMKCKGIPKKVLNSSLYKEEKTEQLPFTSLKKKHNRLSANDYEKGINHFNIIQLEQVRTFNNTKWQGMEYVDGQWYPHNYQFD